MSNFSLYDSLKLRTPNNETKLSRFFSHLCVCGVCVCMCVCLGGGGVNVITSSLTTTAEVEDSYH